MVDFKVEWQINFDRRDRNGIPQITRSPGCSLNIQETDTATFSLIIIQHGFKMNVVAGRFAGCDTDLAKTIEAQERRDVIRDVEVTEVVNSVIAKN